MGISLKQMHYALAVEAQKHFGRAAQACFVTQPALSHQITLLEQHLGWAVFERMGKTVRPTPRGALLLKTMKRIVGQTEEMEEQFTHNPNQNQITLSMALIPTIAPYLLPHLLPGLAMQMDPIRFSACEKPTNDVLAAVKIGECDFGILATDANDERLIQTPLFADPFVLAAPAQCEISTPVDLAGLDRKQMLLLSDGHCLRDQTVDACQMDINLKQTTFAATSLSTIVELVANGMGMTLLPAMSLQREGRSKRIKTLSIAPPGAGRTISMVWRRSSPLTETFQHIADLTASIGRQTMAQDLISTQ